MFTGRVEDHKPILKVEIAQRGLRVLVKKPSFYPSFEVGESLCVDGVCLPLESDNKELMQFFVLEHTLSVTGWNKKELKDKRVNLERPLRFGAPLHGHLVTGHVDTYGRIQEKHSEGEGLRLLVDFPSFLRDDVFDKASIALNGVSLTVARFYEEKKFEVYLIPETLKKTNLSLLEKGDKVNLEGDIMLKGKKSKLR